MSHLTIEQFGRALLTTGDLDPVYTALYHTKMFEAQAARLLIAYWCLYHLGAAAALSEFSDKKFWDALMRAAENEFPPGITRDGAPIFVRWPRGAERRHFRGQNATNAVAWLRGNYRDATDAVLGMLGGDPKRTDTFDFKSIARSVQKHPGFGPWMAFKIADMAERVLGADVDFSYCGLNMYKDPTQGAALAFYEWRGVGDVPGTVEASFKTHPWDWEIAPDDVTVTVDHFVSVFNKYKAPPVHDRPVNLQEVETIFCKYKSYRRGHYHVGKDTDEIGHGLIDWGDTAEVLNQGLNGIRDQVMAWRRENPEYAGHA